MKNAKDYLSQLKYLEKEISDKKEILEMMRAKAESCSSPELNGMPSGSGEGDKLSGIVAKIIDMEVYLRKRIEELNELYYTIIYQIDMIRDRREKDILSKRYLMHKDWLTISDEMECCIQRCYQLHSEALKSFSEIINEIRRN